MHWPVHDPIRISKYPTSMKTTPEQIRTNWLQHGLAVKSEDGGTDLVKSPHYQATDWLFLGYLMWHGWERFYKCGESAGLNKEKMNNLLSLHSIDHETGFMLEDD